MTAFVIPTTRVSSRKTIDFWIEAFGMELLAIYPHDATDVVDHAELRLGDGRVMAGTPREEGLDQAIGGTSMYWVLDAEAEVDAIHAAPSRPALSPYSRRTTPTTVGASARCVIPTVTPGRSGPIAGRGEAHPIAGHDPRLEIVRALRCASIPRRRSVRDGCVRPPLGR